MSIDINFDGTYKLIFNRKSYRKARHRKKADRLVCAFYRSGHGATALFCDAQFFRVKDIG